VVRAVLAVDKGRHVVGFAFDAIEQFGRRGRRRDEPVRAAGLRQLPAGGSVAEMRRSPTYAQGRPPSVANALTQATDLTGSGRLTEGGPHLLFVGEHLAHAGSLLHPLEMPQTIRELGKIEVELGASSKAPEKVRIDGSKMIEEPVATGEHVICDLVVFEELLRCNPPHGFLRARQVADTCGRVNP
jgi:hypothetical protein